MQVFNAKFMLAAQKFSAFGKANRRIRLNQCRISNLRRNVSAAAKYICKATYIYNVFLAVIMIMLLH